MTPYTPDRELAVISRDVIAFERKAVMSHDVQGLRIHPVSMLTGSHAVSGAAHRQNAESIPPDRKPFTERCGCPTPKVCQYAHRCLGRIATKEESEAMMAPAPDRASWQALAREWGMK